MGMVVSFTRVTPEELDRAMDDAEWAEEHLWDLDREPDGYLDKAWDGIQFLLNAAEVPIDLRMDGDFIGEDGCLAGWTVGDVENAARHLRATPFEQLARHFDPARMTQRDIYPAVIWERDDDALDYLREHYEILVKFFDAAAASGSAAIMNFSY
jgi:hypothetical protein